MLTAAVPTLKLALRKKPRSSIGSAVRRSHKKKPPSSTTLAARDPRVMALDQPCSGASMIAYTRTLKPAVESAAPSRSNLPGRGSRLSGT
jgi:hypothetical protein